MIATFVIKAILELCHKPRKLPLPQEDEHGPTLRNSEQDPPISQEGNKLL